MNRTQRRPEPDEYAEYYEGYIRQVPEGEIVAVLRAQLNEVLAALEGIPAERGDHRYAVGKWSIKELLGHMIDTEWTFTYRALCFARGDEGPLPAMDPDEFVEGANFATRELSDLIDELRHVRSANLTLFASFDDEVLNRRGIASDCWFSVRGILYIIAGHVEHHMGVLRGKYL